AMRRQAAPDTGLFSTWARDFLCKPPKNDNREEIMSIPRWSMRSLPLAVALFALPAIAQTGIPGVLAPGVEPELVQEGFVFTEGPVGTADGGLYFSDIRPNKIYQLEPGGKIALIRENTNGSNGLGLTKDGELLAVEGDGKRISKRSRDGTIT